MLGELARISELLYICVYIVQWPGWRQDGVRMASGWRQNGVNMASIWRQYGVKMAYFRTCGLKKSGQVFTRVGLSINNAISIKLPKFSFLNFLFIKLPKISFLHSRHLVGVFL